MKYQAAGTKTCLLLSSLLASAASAGDSGRIAMHQPLSSSNDYVERVMRRLQNSTDTEITDRRAKIKSCAIEDHCDSTYYYYKDFEDGVTFAEAHSAIGNEADLQGCVLAPIYSYEDLAEISAAIPPCKAAYTAAYKDPLRVFREARACVLNGLLPYNCDYEPLEKTLKNLWEGADRGSFGVCSLEEWFGDDFTGGETWCPALKEDGWVNFGSTEEIPSSAWKDGDSSYCGEGPITNAAAAFAIDYNAFSEDGEPTVFLKGLNSGEYLPGAVYKCCEQNVATCFRE